MKIECPNCWQHFDVAPSDLKGEFSCPACDHVFTGREALKLAPRSRKPWIVTVVVLGLLLLVSVVMNFRQWHQLDLLHQTPPLARDSGQQVNLAVALIENYQQELEAQKERLAKLESDMARQNNTLVIQAGTLRQLNTESEALTQRLKPLEELHKEYSLSLMSDQLEAQRRRLLKLSQEAAGRSGN